MKNESNQSMPDNAFSAAIGSSESGLGVLAVEMFGLT
jgi:hypothetical protein